MRAICEPRKVETRHPVKEVTYFTLFFREEGEFRTWLKSEDCGSALAARLL
jgi:hypothetical protein